jgi:hypothetical protein
MAASLFGSSSSLQRKPKERDFTQLKRRKASKKEHRVGKIFTSPRAPQRASSSCPRQDLQKAQEEATSSNWSLLVILWHHLHPESPQPRGLRMKQQLDPPE